MEEQKIYQADVVSTWDEVAPKYDKEEYWKHPENQANLEVLLSHIGNPLNQRIIEVGCGSGLTSIALAERGAKVALLDISPASLQSAIDNFVSAGLPLPEHYLSDALSNKLDSNFFDVVWNGGVIEHFFDEGKKRLLSEMHRIARPGGKIVVLVPNANCWPFQIIQAWQKWRKSWPYGFEDDMSPGRLSKLCQQLGINNYEVYAFNRVLGWRWVPKIGGVLRKMGYDNLQRHTQRSPFGFVSVLVIRK